MGKKQPLHSDTLAWVTVRMKIIQSLCREEEYISSLKQAEVRSEDNKELLSVTESDCLRSKIRQLLWVTGQTRPDASYETSYASLETNPRMEKSKT